MISFALHFGGELLLDVGKLQEHEIASETHQGSGIGGGVLILQCRRPAEHLSDAIDVIEDHVCEGAPVAFRSVAVDRLAATCVQVAHTHRGTSTGSSIVGECLARRFAIG